MADLMGQDTHHLAKLQLAKQSVGDSDGRMSAGAYGKGIHHGAG